MPPVPSRQFQQLLSVHSKPGFEEDPTSIASLVGDPHPQYPGDADVTPLKAGTFGSFNQSTAWRTHRRGDRLPQSLQTANFGSTMFNEPKEFDIPKSYSGRASD